MRLAWESESGLRGRLYALGRRMLPIGWRRAVRRRVAPESLLGIRKPAVPLATLPGPAAGPAGPRADVLVLPVIAWSYRRQRPQQLSEALARRGRRVFYGSVAGSGEPEEPAAVAAGVTLLPLAGVRREDLADRPLDARALGRARESIDAARERFGIARAAVLVESPFWTPLAAALRDELGWPFVYDCLDAHEGFATNRPGVLSGAESDATRAADLVVATSEPLTRRLASGGAPARLLPNACDYELFAHLPPPAPRGTDALVVGYAGALDAWFDFELLAAAARMRPGWRFEIVGGLENAAAAPANLSNVVFFGERPHREMPERRSRFDVEIIPFRLSPLTHATDPVKLYEAAAAGRAVVATPMESLEPLAKRGLVRLAATPE
ncbi:MAG TPA: glycosyltransferase, partial [Thermoanaerobaculia bacterium]|nr:glycosyltransferase [Thermoanaerobaculia bacterium]